MADEMSCGQACLGLLFLLGVYAPFIAGAVCMGADDFGHWAMLVVLTSAFGAASRVAGENALPIALVVCLFVNAIVVGTSCDHGISTPCSEPACVAWWVFFAVYSCCMYMCTLYSNSSHSSDPEETRLIEE